jgi:hypothetical protein
VAGVTENNAWTKPLNLDLSDELCFQYTIAADFGGVRAALARF